MTSYNRALEITRCESIEATLRTIRLLWAGTLVSMTSYNHALEITRCESIETTLRTRRLFSWAGTLIRMMSGGGLPKKRIMFGNLECAVRRGRGGKEKKWTDCVQSDIRAFGITGDWETMALKLRFGLRRSRRVGGGSWLQRGKKKRRTRPDIARKRERQRDWESCYRTRKRRILRSDRVAHW